jgi:exopolysaccharide biosynthesis predicted pyruvyltransferase EpsI
MSAFDDGGSGRERILANLCRAVEANIEKYRNTPNKYLGEDLYMILKALQGAKVQYVVNPGNIGDYLIELGTLTLLRSFDIKVNITDSVIDCHDEIVFFQGGAGFNHLYTVAEELLNDLIGVNPKQIIVLPSTIFKLSPSIASLRQSDIIFAREEQSFEILVRASLDAKVYSSHDLGLIAEVSDLVVDEKTYSHINEILVQESNVPFPKLEGGIIGILLREDLESATEKLEESVDISSYYSWLESQGSRLLRLACFLTYVKQFNIVITDRLHVAVACHLMEIPCRLLENSYGKNSAVALFSLNGNGSVIFENSLFMDSLLLSLDKLKHNSKIELTQQRDELTQQRDELTQQRDELTQQRDELLNSTIWRSTRTLRFIANLFKG